MAVNQLGLHRTANRSHANERSTCSPTQTVAQEAIFTRDQKLIWMALPHKTSHVLVRDDTIKRRHLDTND